MHIALWYYPPQISLPVCIRATMYPDKPHRHITNEFKCSEVFSLVVLTNLLHHNICACHYEKLRWLPLRSIKYSMTLSSLRQNINVPSDTKISFHPDKPPPQLWLVIMTWRNNCQCTPATTVLPITFMIHTHCTITHNDVICYGAKPFS